MKKRVLPFLLSVLLIVGNVQTTFADEGDTGEENAVNDVIQQYELQVDSISNEMENLVEEYSASDSNDEEITNFEAEQTEETVDAIDEAELESAFENTNGASANWLTKGTYGSLTWGITSDYYLIIVGSGKMNDGEPPWFKYRKIIKAVGIGDGVTSIGKTAFIDFSKLTYVKMGDSVTKIGPLAFAGCSSLSQIEIPNGVKIIDQEAFQECTKLKSISIPDSVTSIGQGAFLGCSSLINVTIPNSVSSIGTTAFAQCSSLTNVTIPGNVTSMGEYVFGDCSSLTSAIFSDGVETIGVGAFINCSNLTSVTIPDSVTSIETGAFGNCSSLTSIMIPDSVTSIGENAFYNCTNLTITGSVGSTAETYAKANNIPFIGRNFSKVFGDNRYQTAIAIAKEAYPNGAENVILVKGSDFPDALAANSYAGILKAPILMNRLDRLDEDVKALLTGEWKGVVQKVIILGKGMDASVTKSLENDCGVKVELVAGNNRFETALRIAEETVKVQATDTVFVATGIKAADATSASSWSYAYGYPILLADRSLNLKQESIDFIKNNGIKHVILLGAENVVSDACACGLSLTRLAGGNRWETSTKIAQYFGENGGAVANRIGFAQGSDAHFPDALVAGQLMAQYKAPVILTNDTNTAVQEYLTNNVAGSASSGSTFYFLGYAAKDESGVYDRTVNAINSKG